MFRLRIQYMHVLYYVLTRRTAVRRYARSADPGPAIQWTRRGLTAKTVYCAAAASWMDWIRSATEVETAFPDELPAVPHLDEAPDTRAATSSMDAPRTGPGGEAEADRGSTRRRFDGSPNGALVHV